MESGLPGRPINFGVTAPAATPGPTSRHTSRLPTPVDWITMAAPFSHGLPGFAAT
jgi:hypothetical protein